MRLDKALANSGIGTRKDVKKLIKNGKVTVNGVAIKDSAFHLDPYKDAIFIGPERFVYKKYIYIMMNKPAGVVSATKDNLHKTVIDLLDDKYKHFDLFPAGRLDIDTCGFVLLTNDGDTAHHITSPARKVNKIYLVTVDGSLDQKAVSSFEKGLVLDDGYMTLPAELEILDPNAPARALVTIKEGKFHQVKRMFECLGLKVIFLKRLSMGGIELDESLPYGSYRELTQQEESKLKNEG